MCLGDVSSVLPVDHIAEHAFAEEPLLLGGAKVVRHVLGRPLVVVVDKLVDKAVIDFLQSLAEL